MNKHFITLVSMHIAIIALVGCIFTHLQLVKIPHMHADCKIAWMLTRIIRYMYVHGSPCWKPNTCLKLYCHWEWGHTHTSVSDIHVILWTTYTSLLNKKKALYQEPLSNYQAPCSNCLEWLGDGDHYLLYKENISKVACLNSYFSSTKIIAYKEKWTFVWPGTATEY